MRQFTTAYQHLVTHLDQRIPALRWQDLWWGQTDFPEEAVAFDYPAVFYELAATSQNAGLGTQETSLTLNLYIATTQMAATSEGGQEQYSLDFLELLSEIYERLHGHTIPDLGSLSHLGTSRYNAGTNILVYRQAYQLFFLNDDASRILHPDNFAELTDVIPSRSVNSTPPISPTAHDFLIPQP